MFSTLSDSEEIDGLAALFQDTVDSTGDDDDWEITATAHTDPIGSLRTLVRTVSCFFLSQNFCVNINDI